MALPGWTTAILAAVAATAVAFMLPIEFRARFSFRGPGRGNEMVFELGLFGRLTIWRLAVPLVSLLKGRVKRGLETLVGRLAGGGHGEASREATPGQVGAVPSLPEVRSLGEHLSDVVLGLTRRVRWSRLDWTTTVGLRDAAATALTAGGLWVVKGNLAAVARSKLRLAPGLPRFEVRPDFAARGLESKLDGIGVLRVGHIIFALPRVASGYYHFWRGGRQTHAPGR